MILTLFAVFYKNKRTPPLTDTITECLKVISDFIDTHQHKHNCAALKAKSETSCDCGITKVIDAFEAIQTTISSAGTDAGKIHDWLYNENMLITLNAEDKAIFNSYITAAMLKAGQNGWMPIDDKAKDGKTYFLSRYANPKQYIQEMFGYKPEWMYGVGSYDAVGERWKIDTGDFCFPPTHYMVPSPPSSQEG